MKKLLTFLTLLTLFFGVGWAAEGDLHDMGKSQSTQLNNNASIPSINIDQQSYPIKAVTINWRYNKSTANVVTIEVKVGGVSWGTKSVGTNTTADAVFEGVSTTGAVEIIFTNNAGSGSGKGTFYVNSVTLTEGGSGQQEPDPTAPTGTITFNPASGEVTSGTKVAISFSGTCDGIKYTTNGTEPSANNGTVYDSSNLPTITGATTLKAAAYNTSNSQYAFGDVATATYTISSGGNEMTSTATYIFNTDEGLAALGITKPGSSAGTDLGTNTYTVGDVTLSSTDGSTHTRVWNTGSATNLRVYKSGGSITLAVPADCHITNIIINGSSLTNFSASTGTYNEGTWSGNASSVTFTASGTVNINTITVTYTQSSTASSLYIVGQVNGLSAWSATKAVKMTYDGSKYTAKFYVTGEENSDLNNQGQGTHGGTFAFTTKIGSWGDVNANRYEPPFADQEGGDKNWWLGTSGATNSGQLYKKNYNNSFLIPAGLYEIEVDKDITTFNLKTIKDLTPAFTPASGDVAVGSNATLATAEDFNAFISSCNAFEGTDANTTVVTPEVKLYINNDETSTYNFATAGEVTLTGKAALVAGGTEYAYKTATATFTAVQKYSATIASGITGGSVAFNAAGTQTTLNNLTADYEVRVYVTPSNNYELTTLTYTAEGSTTPVEITTNAGDYYTFNMPAANVTINAAFTYNGPAVTGTTYELINSTEALEVGKKYLVVYETSNYALGGTGNGAYSITIDNHQTTINSDSEVSQFVLGGSEGAWTLYNGSGYLYHTGTSASSVNQTGDGTDDASKWTISFSGDNVTLTSNSSSRLLRYYNKDFRAYQSTSYGQNIQLYKEIGVNDPKFSIPAGIFQNSDYPNGINVALTCATDGATIYYSTDGTNFSEYSSAINVTETTTIYAYATKDGKQSNTVSANYKFVDFLVSDVVFSPASGTYYGNQTCQMFSTSKGARIYYTTDGSDPVMNQGTTQLYTGEVAMPATGTYNFKAVAYIGTTPSEISTASYVISNTTDYVSPSQYNNPKLYSVAELNAVEVPTTEPYYTTSYYEMVNPVQVIYMSTYKNVNNGYPEYCLIRDNTGYGMIYFGKNNSSHAGYTIFEMGDWIGGGYSGQVSNFYDPNQQVLSDTHPELGRSGSGKHIYNWVDEAMSNSAVLPEYLTIPEIKASDPTGAGNDYWGHYVHLRKNTIELVQSEDPGNYTTGQDKDGKWSGTITDENGQSIMYYDKFYLQIDKDWTTTSNDFTGHPNRTFDVYGFVACYKNVYQISPFAFAWIDKPVIDKETATYYEPQKVTLSSLEDPTATIWYKTDDMDDYAVYTEPFEVNSTTTVSWYATKQSQYNDELESPIGSITMTFEEIAKPVISPESNVYAIGESVDASIAFETGKTIANGAEIVYTTDGSDPKTSETAQVYTLGTTMTFTTTTTVRAITRVGSVDRYLYSAEADAETYTFVKSNGIEYTLIDDVTKLKENGVYVIVSQNYSEAMSTIQNVNNRGAAGVLFVEGTNKAKVYGNDDVAQFTLTVLTHDEDTSPERHFLMQTNNSNVNGYLYVGNDVNNSLMTEAEEDAMGNDVAVITIDSDGRAHIHFNYAGGDNRYLQYWNRERYFTTYKTEDADRAVYIYYKNATPLAVIEKEGSTVDGQNDYTIADELVAVWANPDLGMLWCKDQGNVSIAKTDIKDGQVDYMKEVGQQHGEWDQSNWVLLQFPEATPANGIADLLENAVGKYIEPATVSGKYVDSNNYTIEIAHAETYTLALKAGADTTKNVYCTANFLPGNLNINGGQGAAGIYHGQNANYFFMNPKIQEICSITFAEYAGENTFVVPYNDAQIDGAFTIDWSYNEGGPQSPGIGTAYRFVAVVNRTSGSNYLKGGQPSEQIVVYPLDFKASSELPTAINTVDVNGKAVNSVKYVNVAGMVSDKPFSGVNIVVTEYTDGSRTTSKMLRK